MIYTTQGDETIEVVSSLEDDTVDAGYLQIIFPPNPTLMRAEDVVIFAKMLEIEAQKVLFN